MKQTTLLLFVFGFVFGSNLVFAQERFGADSARCVENLSLYKEFVKQKNYKDALNGWRVVFDICPQSSRNIYSDGVKIFTWMISKEKDAAKKDKYVDSLLLVYDKRIEFFGDNAKYPEGWIRGRKGNEIYKYRPENYEDAYVELSKSLSLMGKETEAGIITPLMRSSLGMMEKGKHGCEQVISDYVGAMEVADLSIAAANKMEDGDDKVKELDNLKKVQENLDNLFVSSECATCERVVPIFQEKFNATPDDLELVNKIITILYRGKCTSEQLFFDAAAKLNELEPSAKSSRMLAKMSLVKDDRSGAITYYKKAIELETVDSLKADDYYDLALITKDQGDYQGARNYALNALKMKSAFGAPYLLIGQMYAMSASKCGEDSFTKKVAYWAAVDKFVQAKRVDPSITKTANDLIGSYSLFPGKEEAFFYGVEEGQSYKVGCWINETTTVRF